MNANKIKHPSNILILTFVLITGWNSLYRAKELNLVLGISKDKLLSC